MRTIVIEMIDSQNSSGFFNTQLISAKSLISGISNFDFTKDKNQTFSDSELNIPERLMLGKRAERYFSEWLKRSTDYELIAENIQIIDNKQTLGEFDFIVRRKEDGQLIHIELVYKFYLFVPSVEGSEFEHWIGPNRGDRLDFKLDKLKNHQFPLLFSKPAEDRLADLRIDISNVEQQVLFLANLFIPIEYQMRFTRVNKEAVEGTWMSLNVWEELFDSSALFAIPDKIDWFSRELDNINWMSKEKTIQKIISMHDQKRSPLVYVKQLDGIQRRDFVVWW